MGPRTIAPPQPEGKYLAAAQHYAAQGWPIFPLNGKKPRVTTGFKAATTDAKQIEAWWRKWPDAGIGFCPGRAGLVVLDLDSDDAAEGLNLPPTLEVKTARGRHLYFKHPGGTIANRKLTPKIDLRGDAGYVILPPSTHPRGVQYQWVDTKARIAPLPPGLLDAAIPEGERNNSLTSLTGKLLAQGLSEDEALERVLAANAQRCDPPLGEREVRAIVRSIAKRHATNVPPEFDELNERYAVVLVGNQFAVLEGTASEFRLLSKGAFCDWLRPRSVTLGDRTRPLADAWLSSPHRRQYRDLVFDPSGTTTDCFNLWTGFAIEPSTRGTCDRFLHHLRENLCGGDATLYHWVLGWFAQVFQQPAHKLGTSLAIRGRQGTGKTLIGTTMGTLLGRHYALVSDPRYITGRFNSHLIATLLLHADEAFWAGDHAAAGKLKDLVTGTVSFIELKGKEPVRIKNHVRLMVTGNADWLVPAGMEERRFATLQMGDGQMQDTAFFGLMVEELERGGGYARLLQTLLDFELSTINLRAIPSTGALFDQKLASLPAIEAWWLDQLQSGRLPGDTSGTGVCPTARLVGAYVAHAQRRGERRRSIETVVGRWLRQHVPGVQKVERGDSFHYELPALAVCRDAFSQALQFKVPWDGPDTWVPDALPDEDGPF